MINAIDITKIKSKQSVNSPEKGTLGYVDNFSDLWVRGWLAHAEYENKSDEINYKNCIVYINDTPIISFDADIYRGDLDARPELKHGRGYEFQLPAQKVAKAIDGCDVIEVSVSYRNELVPHSLDVHIVEWYCKVFSNLYDDINYYLSHLALFTPASIKYLSPWQVAFLLDVLLKTKLYLDLPELMSCLCNQLSLKGADEKLDELVMSLCYQDDFMSILLASCDEKIFQHELYSCVKRVFENKRHIETDEIIEKSIKDKKTQDKLRSLFTDSQNKKFSFIENFPEDTMSGVQAWEQLNLREKQDYWPMLVSALQFQSRYEDLKYIEYDLAWYLRGEPVSDNHIEQLKQAINAKENSWFSLSFVVHAKVCGLDDAHIAEMLKLYAWNSWHLDFFDSHTFCQIIKMIITSNDAITVGVYEDICTALDNVIRFKADAHKNDLLRKSFIETVASVINLGATLQFASFSKLEEIIRPHLALNNDFCSLLELDAIEFFDISHYEWLKGFYGQTALVRQFFEEFDFEKKYSDIYLIEVIQRLCQLKNQYHVLDVDSKFLTLSRYCRLTERKRMYSFLKSIHLEMRDYYSALYFSSDRNEVNAITRMITETGDNKKKPDSYWYRAALQARKDATLTDNVQFISRLTHYLKQSKKTEGYINADLIQLLISEMIWRASCAGSLESLDNYIVDIFNSYASDHFCAFKLITAAISVKDSSRTDIEKMDAILENVGGASRLMGVIESLGMSISRLQQSISDESIFKSIRERFVFPYTCVCIYSCNKYVDSRHKILRNTWIKDLNSYDIDYKIVVGDAEESHIDGDMMRLAVNDTYEALPQKSIEMFRFAKENLMHQYFYKLDDDCILNVVAMFSDPTFLNHNYFGRTVTRILGGVDRRWHHLKSSSQEAKEALDLSPENSSYCEGSTGYIVSRDGIDKLNQVVRDPANVQLISSSYFEDKLIGDLMALANVPAENKGYNCVIRRKFAAERDVQIWSYGVLPNSDTNIKVVHTESDQFRLAYHKNFSKNRAAIPPLLYRDATSDMEPKFWPDNQQSPVLEIISINKSAIKDASSIAIIVGKNEQLFLPGLLAHHRKIGVEHFLFVDNASSDSSIEYMLEQEDVSVFVTTQDYKFSRFGVNWQETLLSHYCMGKWALILDSDELFVYDDFENKSIKELLTIADSCGANAVLSPMVDFYPKETLSKADISDGRPFYEVCNHYDSLASMNVLELTNYGPFGNSKIYSSGLRERIFGRYNTFPEPNYLNQKYNLIKYRPGMKLIEGLHFMAGHNLFEIQCGIMHFKYHSKFHEKVEREVKAGQHWNGAKEYVRYLGLTKDNKNFSLYDEKISREYCSSKDLVEAGYMDKISWYENHLL